MDNEALHLVSQQPMERWQRAAARVRAGTGRARLLVVGDSTSCGAGAGTGGVCQLDGAYANSWPQLLARLDAPLVPFSANSVIGTQGTLQLAPAVYDPRLSPGAGWAASAGTATLGGAQWGFTGAAASAFAFTPVATFDTVTIRYIQQAGPGTFSVNVDGGAPLGTVMTAGTRAYASVTHNVPPGSRTVNIVANGDGTVFIGAIETSNSAVPAVDVLQGAWFGAKAINFAGASAAWSPLNAIPLFAPDLTIINLTINDCNGDTPLADYQTQMQQIISAALITGDVLLMVGAPSGTAQATDGRLDRLIAVLNQLALTNGCALLSIKERWGSYAAIQTTFPYHDMVHPGALANQDEANAVYAALNLPEQTAPVLRQSVQTRPSSMIARWFGRVWPFKAK